jgi:hypothetical protein
VRSSRAGNKVAKRRRSNGSLEEALPLGEAAPLAFDESSPANEPPPPPGLERTEILDPPRIPAPLLNPAPRTAEQSARNGPPEAIPIGNASLAAPEPVPPVPPGPIELRIRRLEDALAHLQQMRAAELRVTTALPARPAVPVAVPMPAPPPQVATDRLWELGKRVLTSPVEAARSFARPPGDPRSRPGWLVFESVTEARAIVRMFTDPRYRLSWTSRIMPPALLVLILASWWWVPFISIPIFGNILAKTVELALAYVLFKLLGHEARRYRETAPDLPPSLRL